MSLRILGGRFKNRPLKSPPESLARPTTSILRKAVFDICQDRVNESYFIDLFSCTGAMGIEAISRGASYAVFVEKERKIAYLLKENLQSFNIQEQTSVIIGDALHKLPPLYKENTFHTIVYIDPPYPLIQKNKGAILELLHLLDRQLSSTFPCTLFLEEGFPSLFSFTEEPFDHLLYKDTRKFSAALLHQFSTS